MLYSLNQELNGIEIYFDEKPEATQLATLKASKWRWNGKKLCWYTKQSPEALTLAEALTNGLHVDIKTGEQLNEPTTNTFRKTDGEKIILSNEYCYVSYTPNRKNISGRDKTDRNNDPSFYNRKVQNIKKAWVALETAFDDNFGMYDCMHILEDNRISCHSYCAMD